MKEKSEMRLPGLPADWGKVDGEYLPDTKQAMELDRLKAEVERYKKALEHYADPLNWGRSEGKSPGVRDWYSAVDDETNRYKRQHGYTVAQEALTAVESGENENER